MAAETAASWKEGEASAQREEHILVCLSSAPSNARIIRAAARMAWAFGSPFTALFVETPDYAVATPENKERLQENLQLARKLGARVEVVYGADVPYQIASFARITGVTKIVMGRGTIARRHHFGSPPLVEQLLSYAPDVDVHIIPDKAADAPYLPRRAQNYRPADILRNAAVSLGILLAATLLSLLFHRLGFADSNIIMVYILGVLLTSIATSHQVYSLVSSIASVFIFNYLFTVPRFSLAAYGTGYPLTFVVMFLTAFITGTFAIRYKAQAGQSAKIAHRTRILFDTSQLLSKAAGREQILEVAATQVNRLLDHGVVIFAAEDGALLEPRWYPRKGQARPDCDMEQELATANWVLAHNHSAGATTEQYPDARFRYFALRVGDRVYGVIGIDGEEGPLDASENDMLLSILGESALALENEKNAREKEAAAILAKSEQLRANILRTISHDLRTPLTSISGNASNLLSNDNFDEKTKKELYRDIYEDSVWLISLVENLLSATRIEEGRMTLHTGPELVGDLVEAAARHMKRKAANHVLTVDVGEELLLVRVDPKLITQVIVNLLDNAVKYTPAGSHITVTARAREAMAEVTVSDDGPGISDTDKERIFEKFYCGEQKIADSRRSLGLGLFLCRSIVEAHGGQITLEDNQPRGARFCLTLPREEVTLHE